MTINPFSDGTDYPPLRLEPLRLVKKPYKAVFNGRKQWQFHLSDGRILNLYQWAVALQIDQPSAWERNRTMDWRDAEIMTIGRRKKKRKKEPDLSHIPAGIFAHLSDSPRG